VDVNGNSLGYKYILGHIEDSLVEKYDPCKNNIIQPGQAVELSGNTFYINIFISSKQL
jgi:hypothetical protein